MAGLTLLREIQDAAISADGDLTVVLRKCLVLASRLDHAPLRDWARSELDGYPTKEGLPDYRRTGNLDAVGSFMRGGVQFFPRLRIPMASVPEQHHDRLFRHQFLSPVAALQPLADGEKTLSVPWPSDAVAAWGSRIYEDMVCLDAHVELSSPMVAGVLDTIRNRVLALSLEIEKEAPDAGDQPGESPVSAEKLTQLFQTFILAPVGALAVGSTGVSQSVHVDVVPGDFASLRAALEQLGLAEDDISSLGRALEADAPAQPPGKLGPETSSWLDRFRGRATSGAVTVGTGVSAGLLTDLIARFLGWS